MHRPPTRSVIDILRKLRINAAVQAKHFSNIAYIINLVKNRLLMVITPFVGIQLFIDFDALVQCYGNDSG